MSQGRDGVLPVLRGGGRRRRRIKIVFNYTGTNQLFTFALDALNSTGTRIAVNVTLTVTGNSLRILDGAGTQYTSYTTSTSASTSTIVNAAIIAAGPSSVATTIAL